MMRKCLLYRENAKPNLDGFSSHKRCVLRGNCKASRSADATDVSYGFRSSKSLRFPLGVEFGQRGFCSVKSRVSHFDFVTPSAGTFLGAWLGNVVEAERVSKCLTVRDLISSSSATSSRIQRCVAGRSWAFLSSRP